MPINPYTGMLDVRCEVEIVVGTASITVLECLKLERNSVLRLAQAAGSDLQIRIQGILVATGEITVDDDTTSVKVSEVLPPPSAEARS
jgi:flagellar motor switch/type III secretory pathway protein FliN